MIDFGRSVRGRLFCKSHAVEFDGVGGRSGSCWVSERWVAFVEQKLLSLIGSMVVAVQLGSVVCFEDASGFVEELEELGGGVVVEFSG